MQNRLESYTNLKNNPSALQLAKRLDPVAQRSKQSGYSVTRIPGLLNYGGGPESGPVLPSAPSAEPKPIDSSTEIPVFADFSSPSHLLTPSNVLTESYYDQDGKPVTKVYVPDFGIPVINQEIRRSYANLGVSLVPVSGFVGPSRGGGLLDCWTNEVRDPVVKPSE